VSTKGLESNVDFKGTSVYVYAKNVRQITSSTSVEVIIPLDSFVILEFVVGIVVKLNIQPNSNYI
jgi:hypothetical protein